MKKDTKAMIFLVGGIAVVGIGTYLLPPSWLVPIIITDILGCVMFALGAYWTLKSIAISAIGLLKDANRNTDLTPRRKLFSLLAGLTGLGIVGYCVVQLIRLLFELPRLFG